MKASYITLVGTTQRIMMPDTNIALFALSIRAPAGVTVQIALEDPGDVTPSNSYSPVVTVFPYVWLAAPTAVNGLISINFPISAVLLTPTAGGQVTMLQQGVV